MKKNLTLILAFLIVFAVVNLNSVSAQLTISIPKVPKIKKQDSPKSVENQTTQNTRVTVNSRRQSENPPSESKTQSPDQTNAPPDWWLDAMLDDIKKLQ